MSLLWQSPYMLYRYPTLAFEKWCESEEPRASIVRYEFHKVTKLSKGGRSNETLQKLADEMVRQVLDTADKGDSRVVVTCGQSGFESLHFDFDFSQTHKPKGWQLSKLSHIYALNIHHLRYCRCVGGVIRDVSIGNNAHRVEFDGCAIAKLFVAEGSMSYLKLNDCMIGTLIIPRQSLQTFIVNGGTIRSIVCPPPQGDNPFTGSVSLSPKVDFPTSTKRSGLFEGPQNYRSMRKHLENLEDVPNANRMRVLELRAERQRDHGLNKIVSWAYDLCAAYGYKPGRPLWIIFGLYLAVSFLLWKFDGGVLGIDPTVDPRYYSGWRTVLTEPGTIGQFARSFALPIQSVLSPFGLFGVRKLVMAATTAGQLLLFFQGLFTYLLLLMTVFGVRKRFKLS